MMEAPDSPTPKTPAPPRVKARLIALYLQQFHPIPENDAWWGKGFTEWTNVARAKPLYPGHYQPRLPADLGFYDLRVPEVRTAQAELARQAGIEGFCYWHYWFAGRRVLERPFNEVLASGEPDYPFCLAWANDTWSGHWYGAERRVLIEQTYPGEDDHRRHFEALLPAFHDPRYIRVNNRPFFAIYRPKALPNTEAFIALWQRLARENGLTGIHFVAYLFDFELDYPWREVGYNASVMTNEHKLVRHRMWHVTQERLRLAKSSEHPGMVADAITSTVRLLRRRVLQRVLKWPGGIYDYRDAMLFFKSRKALDLGCYPTVLPNWDNTARSGRKGIVLHGSTPELFGEHLRDVLGSVADRPAEERIVFVKSWNEWAEGNHLEPDARYGHGYLDEVRRAVVCPGTKN